MRKIAAVLLLMCFALPVLAKSANVSGMRVWTAPDHVRLVLDTDVPLEHKLFTLKNPQRVVVDIQNARLSGDLPVVGRSHRWLGGIRGGKQKGADLRVVLDLKTNVRPKSFLLSPNQQYGHRLVIDLYPTEGVEQAPAPVKKIDSAGPSDRDIVVAIDAGHGGEDGGARGPKGIREKDVTLAIARKLERLVRAEKGMRPVLIRDGDYYLGLRKRMKKARSERADIFISIHADAFKDSRVHGSSVYTLSEKGASSEAARWIASQENKADVIGGVELGDKDDMLRTVLVDLSQSAAMHASAQAAGYVLSSLKTLGKTHKRTVQQANFMVLKSPDIPSLLVETAFISNPQEERRLSDPRHQQKLAESLMEGVKGFFRRNPPPGTLWAAKAPKRHVINHGETLSEIASRYEVSLKVLRRANKLDGDTIRVGQVLTIPRS